MKEIELTIKSQRNSDIPVSIIDSETTNAGLVIFVHGFKANRHEDGRFTLVGQTLASHGISSIRMGFAGCDESKEDFINYTLKNCLDDIDSSINYMLDNYSINKGRIGMLGYSMGGRLTGIYTNKHSDLKCLGFWAGATYPSFEDGFFLGEDVNRLKQEASEKGYCQFHNSFDNTFIRLNKDLIAQMEEYNPLEGLYKYEGNAIVVHGDKDITVKPKVVNLMNEALSKANKKIVIIKGADHGFGQWDNKPELSKMLVEETIGFFIENM